MCWTTGNGAGEASLPCFDVKSSGEALAHSAKKVSEKPFV